MFDASTEALETAQVIHSFLERWSVEVFLAVVALDIFLHLIEESTRLEWTVEWTGISVWRLRLPGYSGRISIRALAKTLSLLGFGLAIALEFFAVPYGERVDELTTKEGERAQKQLFAALATAGSANKEAGIARRDAGDAIKESARLTKENLILRVQVLNLQRSAAPRRLTEAQKLDLITRLSRVPSPVKVEFAMPNSNGTKETFDFTDDLKDVFVRMKLMPSGALPTGRGRPVSPLPSLLRGVMIGVQDRTKPPPSASVLFDFLTSLGLDASILSADGTTMTVAPNELFIAVGNKQ